MNVWEKIETYHPRSVRMAEKKRREVEQSIQTVESINDGAVICTKCNWFGSAASLKDYVKCPKCGQGKYIEDFLDEVEEPMHKLFGGFNWNKK